jgi:chromosome condensin MukBEF ATPase and DNA-binding subunit MukB
MVKCNCLTKTPEAKYHKKDCPVALVAEIERLEEQLSESRDMFAKVRDKRWDEQHKHRAEIAEHDRNCADLVEDHKRQQQHILELEAELAEIRGKHDSGECQWAGEGCESRTELRAKLELYEQLSEELSGNSDTSILTTNILRHWSADQRVRFAAHLLGDKCQELMMSDRGNWCTYCGSTKLSWYAGVNSNSGVVDGRHFMSEISAIFILGCDECSETLMVVPGSEVAAMLNHNKRS